MVSLWIILNIDIHQGDDDLIQLITQKNTIFFLILGLGNITG